MAYFFMDVLRNNGRPFNYTFDDLEARAESSFKFSLIEMASYQIHGQVRFRLSNHGLDLLFKTKEVYKELRLSISQLYLRQQIEKGVFSEALRTVDDMYVQVKEIQAEINGLKQRIVRNVSQVSIAEYAGIVEMNSSRGKSRYSSRCVPCWRKHSTSTRIRYGPRVQAARVTR